MDIGDWLRSLGLERYEAAFRENEIDDTVLPTVTAEDLKDLGVDVVGHRRKLLNAISALRADADAKAPPPTTAPRLTAAATAVPTPEAVGERRHVTVMFCDLVDSTGIAARLDAEEWRDLVGAYLDAASAAVTEMGGKVAKKLGDGLMALFGYPVAQENDAERAVRAALAIQRALAELNRKNAGTGKPALAARIAIDSGPVVVDASGEIFGDVPNIAARAQALAEPGAVVVTARVQRQVAGLFVAEERGSHELKGVPEPVTLFRLVRASGGGRRAGQRHLTPLVGRDEEIAMLMRRWERARQGDGQLVLIVGEPGLGKSRLIEEFHARLRETPHTWVEWSCSQLLQNTPLHPIAEWGRQRFGGADVPAEQRLAELESSLAQVKLDPAENVPLLAPLLDIPLPAGRASTLRAGGIAASATGGADELGDGRRAGSADGAGARRCALGRSDHARSLARHRRTRRAGALVRSHDRPAGVSAALGHALASRHHFAGAARPPSGAGDGGRACRPTRAAEGSGRGRDRAHWRCAAVRRGSDAAPIGARRAGRHPGDPADAAAIADRAARPARSSARGGADRRRDRSRLLLCAAARRGRHGGRSHCRRRWNGSPRRTSCWCRACRRNPIIASSTRSFRTRPTKICSRAGARFCTAASARRCATLSPPPLRPSRNCWRITSPRRA